MLLPFVPIIIKRMVQQTQKESREYITEAYYPTDAVLIVW